MGLVVSTSTMSSWRSLAFATARMAVLRGLFFQNVLVGNPKWNLARHFAEILPRMCTAFRKPLLRIYRLHKSELMVESKEGLLAGGVIKFSSAVHCPNNACTDLTSSHPSISPNPNPPTAWTGELYTVEERKTYPVSDISFYAI